MKSDPPWMAKRGIVLKLTLILPFLICSLSRDAVALTLYTVGPDLNGVPRVFNSVSTAGVTSPLFALGDGSLGFNGGLAFNPADGLFYGIVNDSLGNSSLTSFSDTDGGSFSTIGSLGQGFISGLAFDSANGFLYGISMDLFGQSALNRISMTGAVAPVGSLGIGFMGGLVYDSSNGLLYAFSSDAFGVQRVFTSIDPTSAAVNSLFALGDGLASFNGGLAFDPASGEFFVISNDFLGNSTLSTLTLGDELTTQASNFGVGFNNVGLAEVAEVPEAATLSLLLAGGLAAIVCRFKSRPRPCVD